MLPKAMALLPPSLRLWPRANGSSLRGLANGSVRLALPSPGHGLPTLTARARVAARSLQVLHALAGENAGSGRT